MKNKVLFVSIAFPPKNDPECIQAGRYLYYLQKKDAWEIISVTSAIPTLFMPYDKSLEPYLGQVKRKVEIKVPENKYTNFLIRKINPHILERPDSKFLFHLQWKKVTKSIKNIDIIYSRSFPLSSTIMAYKLKKRYNVPWVMHLSDPWCESPLSHYSNKSLAYHEKWEKLCFNEADIISFTTKRALELYAFKFPDLKHKFKVFPNVYDPNEIIIRNSLSESHTKANTLKIVYTGGLANTRTAEVFINALNLLSIQEQELLSKLEIIFAGDMDAYNRGLFEHNKLNFLNHVGVLTSKEANKLQMEADILLVIDSKIKDARKNVFFPSKLLDYAIKGKFILGITEANSPTEEFIVKNNGIAFSFKDERAIANWIKKVLSDNSLIKGQKKIDRYFSAEEQSNELSQLFKQLLDGK